jgi:hypothetical protein
MDYIYMEKNRSATFEFRGAKNPIAPLNCTYGEYSIPVRAYKKSVAALA